MGFVHTMHWLCWIVPYIVKLLSVLTLLWRMFLSYRNQTINLFCKSMDWFLYDRGLRHERVKTCFLNFPYAINCYFLIEISFKHDFIVDTPYLGKSFPDLFCKYLLFRKNIYEDVHFVSKIARKRRAVLLKMKSFIGLFMV